MADALLTLLLTLAPAHADLGEPPAERVARLGVLAGAIAEAAQEATCEDGRAPYCDRIFKGPAVELAAVLAATAFDECRFARNIHAGKCEPHECDAVVVGGEVRHRAVSVWQLHVTRIVPRPVWEAARGDGVEATTTAAWAAAQVLAVLRRQVVRVEGRTAWACAFSAYAGVEKCSWKGAPARARLAEGFQSRLTAMVGSSP